jgi:DNA-binding NarL/FixJ family response regulator
LLLDLNLPGAYGFCALAHLRGSHPELPVIVVSAMDDLRTVRQALALGAQGFISKSADAGSIGRDVQSVLRGEYVPPVGLDAHTEPEPDSAALDFAQRLAQLTAQQFRVFGMLCLGRLNKHIAYELQITEATVKAHMTAILRKLGAANRTQAVLLAGRLLLDPHEIRAPPEEVE